MQHGESRLESVSNLSSSSSLSSSVSLSSISSSSRSTSSRHSSIRSSPNMSSGQNTIVLNNSPGRSRLSNKRRNLSRSSRNSVPRVPDSNEFNFWFECSSLSSGVISIDLALDAGQPDEQLKFLRLHDAKTKRLYFLWSNEVKSSRRVCGCVGGCYYYSVFPDKATNRADGFDFFDLAKSISRTSPNFGQSLFVPSKHVLQSQPIMQNKLDFLKIIFKCVEYH